MKLIIMRHGEADTFGLQDEQRCLTPNGIKQAEVAGEWLSQFLGENKSIDYALVSSFTRAEQTFQEVQKEVQCLEKQISNDVIPSGEANVAHDFIRVLIESNPKWQNMLVVSHMPFVSYFIEEVTINHYSMLFDTSSMVVIDYDLDEMGGLVESIYHPH